MSVCPSARNNKAQPVRIFIKYDKEYFSKIRRQNVNQNKKKSAAKIQVSLICDKTNCYFTGRPTYIYNISLNSSEDETFLGKSCRKNQNTNFTFNNFISENRTVGDVAKWYTGRTRQQCPRELHPGYLRLQTLKIWNLFLFQSNNGCTNAPQLHLYVHSLSCFVKVAIIR